MNFTPFVMSNHNSITIVNTYEHVDFSKLLKGPTEHYNDVDIPMNTIIAGRIRWITTPGSEKKTVNYYKHQTKGSGSSPHHRVFSHVLLLQLQQTILETLFASCKIVKQIKLFLTRHQE